MKLVPMTENRVSQKEVKSPPIFFLILWVVVACDEVSLQRHKSGLLAQFDVVLT
jgi:hypothetical protein